MVLEDISLVIGLGRIRTKKAQRGKREVGQIIPAQSGLIGQWPTLPHTYAKMRNSASRRLRLSSPNLQVMSFADSYSIPLHSHRRYTSARSRLDFQAIPHWARGREHGGNCAAQEHVDSGSIPPICH
jgi:hypothetical protein